MEIDANGQERSPSVHKRRWHQYSLRSLLLLVTLCACFCSWLGIKIDQGKRQKAAVDVLMAKGWLIRYDYEVDQDGNELPKPALNVPQWLRSCLGDDCFATVVGIHGSLYFFNYPLMGVSQFGPVATDEIQETNVDFQPLKELSHLKFLRLTGTNAGDSTLALVRNLPELRYLGLSHTQITDVGLVELKAFPDLRELDLSGTRVTDSGIANLMCLDRLERLKLAQTRVTDRTLNLLQKLKNLKRLSFLPAEGMAITHDGVARFKQALPNCEVIL